MKCAWIRRWHYQANYRTYCKILNFRQQTFLWIIDLSKGFIIIIIKETNIKYEIFLIQIVQDIFGVEKSPKKKKKKLLSQFGTWTEPLT